MVPGLGLICKGVSEYRERVLKGSNWEGQSWAGWWEGGGGTRELQGAAQWLDKQGTSRNIKTEGAKSPSLAPTAAG